MRMLGQEGHVALCEKCAEKIEEQGYFDYHGTRILVLNDEKPKGVADVVAENYSPHAAKWIRGRRPEDGA